MNLPGLASGNNRTKALQFDQSIPFTTYSTEESWFYERFQDTLRHALMYDLHELDILNFFQGA
jgi:hypothetical protein